MHKRGRGINGQGEEEEEHQQQEEEAAVVPLLVRRRRTTADTNTTPRTLARVSSIEALRGRIHRHSCAYVAPPREIYLRKKKQPQSVNVSCDEILRMFQMRVALANGASECSRGDLPHSLPGAVRCPT